MLTELEALAAEFFGPASRPDSRIAEARAAWMRARPVVVRRAMSMIARPVLDLRPAAIAMHADRDATL